MPTALPEQRGYSTGLPTSGSASASRRVRPGRSGRGRRSERRPFGPPLTKGLIRTANRAILNFPQTRIATGDRPDLGGVGRKVGPFGFYGCVGVRDRNPTSNSTSLSSGPIPGSGDTCLSAANLLCQACLHFFWITVCEPASEGIAGNGPNRILEQGSQSMDGVADSENPQGTGDIESKDPRERSSIGFPYVPLDDAVAVAQSIQDKVGTGLINDDQLAPALDMSQKSSGYRTKLSAARLFTLIESFDGGHKLSDLGKRIVDPQQERAARSEAFLAVPLYSRVYEEYKGAMVPPAAALERQFVSFGVAQKQTARARQVLERSAEQANFFEVGRDRLVRPTIKQGDAPKPKNNQGGGDGNGGANDGGGGGGGDEFSGLDPLVAGLLRRMPKTGAQWPIGERARWLQTLAMNLSFIHDDGPDEQGITVTVTRG